MTTAKQVLNRAMASSTANDPDSQVTPTEALAYINDRLAHHYNRGATVNPAYFGDIAEVDTDGGDSWPRPSNAARVILVELADGTEVNVVPVNNRSRVHLPPRIYRWGDQYYSVGEDGDPTNLTALRIFFAKEAPELDSIDDEIPAEFGRDHIDVLVYELAVYISLKDKARDDMASLNEMLKRAIEEFERDLHESDANFSTAHTRTHGVSSPSVK